MTEILIKRLSKNIPLPKYETDGSSGMDIAANVEENIEIDQNSLIDKTRSFIASYKLPKKIIFVSNVERAPNGKANYKWAKNIADEDFK